MRAARAALALALLAPAAAWAQGKPGGGTTNVVGDDTSPPGVWFDPGDGAVSSATLTVTIHWCDNSSLNSASKLAKLDGQPVTVTGFTSSTYAGCAKHATSTVTLWLSPGAPHTLYASVEDNTGKLGAGQAAYTYAVGAGTVTLVSPKLSRDPSLCALACGEVVQMYSTPAYVSLDVPRSLTLVYRSGRARPLPVVELDVGGAPSGTAKLGLKLVDANGAAVPLTSGGTEVVRSYANAVNRLAAQFAASFSGPADFARAYTAVVTAYKADGTVLGTTPIPVRVPIDWLNGPQSPYGVGWGVAGVQQWRWASATYDRTGGLVLVDGDGAVGYWAYAGVSGSVYRYASPPGDFSTVTWDEGAGVLTRRYPDGTVATLDGSGNQAALTDRLGNATRFAYASFAEGTRLTGITDPAGHTISVGYRAPGDASGWRLRSLEYVADNVGRSVYFGVDGANDLRLVNEPIGTSDATRANTRYWAYGAHALEQIQDARGGTWGFRYDGVGTLGRTVTAAGVGPGGTARDSTEFLSWANAVLVPYGQGTLASPAPAVDAYAARAVVYANATGLRTAVRVDGWGAAVQVEAPGGDTTRVARDALGRVTQTLDARRQVVDYVWNTTKGYLLDSTYDVGARVGTAYIYDAASYDDLKQVRVGGQEVEFRTYSGGRLATVRAGGPTQRAATYDYTGQPAGDPRPAKVTDPRGHVTTYVYESSVLRNTMAVTSPAGTSRVTHDAFGRDSIAKNPRGDSTVTAYDVVNRPTRVTDPLGYATTTAYDALFPRTVTDAVGQVYRDSVNALGLPVQAVAPDTGAAPPVTTTYDAAGRVSTVTNRRGGTVTLGYDPALGTLASRTTSDGYSATYGTDALGRVRWARNAESVDSVFTDALGRDTLAVHRIPALSIRHLVRTSYDTLGRRTGVESYNADASGRPVNGDAMRNYGGGTTTYTYDPAGRLSRVGVGGTTATLGYNEDGGPTTVAWPNGTTVTDGYSPAHTLASRRYSRAPLDAALGRVFSFDAAMRLTSRFNAAQTVERRYGYDAAGQLTSHQDFAVQPSQCTPDNGQPTGSQIVGDQPMGYNCTGGGATPLTAGTTYQWDAVGNPVRPDVTIVPNSGNRMGWANNQNLSDDSDGNLRARIAVDGTDVQRLSWNSLGQLTGVWNNPLAGSGFRDSVTFGYDGWGRRVRKTDVTTGVTTYFVWDGDALLGELDGTGRPVARFHYTPGAVDGPVGVMIAPTSNGAASTYWYATEPPGHVTGLVDAANNLAARYTYQPFGVADTVQESLAGGWTNRLRYGAREYDAETGLYYNRARYYDPRLGRFISPDPIGLGGGINRYAYAGNSPTNATDPSGLYCEFVTTYEWTDYYGPNGYNGSSPRKIVDNEYRCDDPTPPQGPTLGPGGPGGLGGTVAQHPNAPKLHCPALPADIAAQWPENVNLLANIAYAQSHIATQPMIEDFISSPRLAAFASMVDTRKPWDIKGVDQTKQDAGNFHYAVVGRASGISGGMLLWSAGVQQFVHDGRLKFWKRRGGYGAGTPLTGQPWGDAARDRDAILRGLAFAKACGL